MSPAPSGGDPDWDARVADLWSRADALPPADLVAAIDALAAERPAGDAAALFERACVRDTTGDETGAEAFYREALARPGLDDYRRCRATLQLASTLRILGQPEESERLLVAELDRHLEPGNPRLLHDEARAILAFTWLAQGRAQEAAGLALATLVPHLSRYNRSMEANASALVKKSWR